MRDPTEIERAFLRYQRRKKVRAARWAIGGFVAGALFFGAGMLLGWLLLT